MVDVDGDDHKGVVCTLGGNGEERVVSRPDQKETKRRLNKWKAPPIGESTHQGGGGDESLKMVVQRALRNCLELLDGWRLGEFTCRG